jgi:hypothetical protein
MVLRPAELCRVALVLSSAFIVGGASAEVAVRTHAAVEQVQQERASGSSGELVALRLTGPDGQVLAEPRLIAPTGKAAELVLHYPGRPDDIRLAFRVQSARHAQGTIGLKYAVWVPDHGLSASGELALAPGVQRDVALRGGQITASWLAVPFPSPAFDAYMQAQRLARGVRSKA